MTFLTKLFYVFLYAYIFGGFGYMFATVMNQHSKEKANFHE